jgi:hypothetical protein
VVDNPEDTSAMTTCVVAPRSLPTAVCAELHSLEPAMHAARQTSVAKTTDYIDLRQGIARDIVYCCMAGTWP